MNNSILGSTENAGLSHHTANCSTELLTSLRQGTGSAHQALHHHPALQKLDTGVGLSHEYLHHALCRFYGFHAGIEKRIYRTSHANVYTRHATPILNNLENDIHLFGSTRVATIQTYQSNNAFDELEAIWAYLYVKEGSLLGGRVIHKTLTKNLPEYEDKYQYFAGLQDKTAQHWKTFTQTLIQETQILDGPRIVGHANTLFKDLYVWMN